MTRRQAAVACTALAGGWAAETKARSSAPINLFRVPDSGLQPQVAVGARGLLHLVYYKGEGSHGDVFYVKSADGGQTFSPALRVNSQSGSAIAAGTIRGAQIALGKSGRVHVAWNGSNEALPRGPLNSESGKSGAPMLYARLSADGTMFEPQRNLMMRSTGLDGGGSVAADAAGNVYVAWHGIDILGSAGVLAKGEAERRVWVSKSTDDGRSFAAEREAWSKPTGACGCCATKIFAGQHGELTALYRSATESVHRDMYLLNSDDEGQRFQGSLLQNWTIGACPMSSMDITENGGVVVGAWETAGQVYWARLEQNGGASRPIQAPGEGKGRKHPRAALNRNGDVLLVWTEGTGWQRGGSLSWQVFDRNGSPTSMRGQSPGIPTWSFASAADTLEGFSIFY